MSDDDFTEIKVYYDTGCVNSVSTQYDATTDNIAQCEQDIVDALVLLGYTDISCELIVTPTVTGTATRTYTVRLFHDTINPCKIRLNEDSENEASFDYVCTEGDYILLEDGLPILLEDGDYMLLE